MSQSDRPPVLAPMAVHLFVFRPSVRRMHPAATRHCCGFAAVGPAAGRYRSEQCNVDTTVRQTDWLTECRLREYWTIRITHCTSYLHHKLQHHRTITSDTAPMTDNCINTRDTWVTVILWQGYYTKIHTDSVTYVNANSSFFSSLLYRLYHLCIVHVISSAVCQMW